MIAPRHLYDARHNHHHYHPGHHSSSSSSSSRLRKYHRRDNMLLYTIGVFLIIVLHMFQSSNDNGGRFNTENTSVGYGGISSSSSSSSSRGSRSSRNVRGGVASFASTNNGGLSSGSGGGGPRSARRHRVTSASGGPSGGFSNDDSGKGSSDSDGNKAGRSPRIKLLQRLTPMRTFVGARSRASPSSSSASASARANYRQQRPRSRGEERAKSKFVRDAIAIFKDGRSFNIGDYHEVEGPKLNAMTPSDMDIQFLGTASCMPSTTRSVSCLALRKDGDIWLFDAGEGSQIQIQKSNHIRTSKVSKIFITHLHGDHCFGLAGLLCLMGAQTDDDKKRNQIVEIYGPKGLRSYVRASLRMTYSRIVPPYVVHELIDVPYTHGHFDSQVLPPFATDMTGLPRHPKYGEVEGGRDIFPDRNGVYNLFKDPSTGLTVKAAALRHTVPTVGFCISEDNQPGTLNFQHVGPIVERNLEGLRLPPYSMADPKKIFRSIKEMKSEEVIEFPDGTKLKGSEAVFPPLDGRKVVILGDTCDPSGPMDALAEGCDILVHEATNAWIREFDIGKTPMDVASETFEHGHSTPGNAGAYARNVGARRLILNHFSSRYKGDTSQSSRSIMKLIEHQAALAFHQQDENGAERGSKEDDVLSEIEGPDVIAAWDLMHLPIARKKNKNDPDVLGKNKKPSATVNTKSGNGMKERDSFSPKANDNSKERRPEAGGGDDKRSKLAPLSSPQTAVPAVTSNLPPKTKAEIGGDSALISSHSLDSKRHNLKRLKIPELKEMLTQYGLIKTGKKEDLINRLLEHEERERRENEEIPATSGN